MGVPAVCCFFSKSRKQKREEEMEKSLEHIITIKNRRIMRDIKKMCDSSIGKGSFECALSFISPNKHWEDIWEIMGAHQTDFQELTLDPWCGCDCCLTRD